MEIYDHPVKHIKGAVLFKTAILILLYNKEIRESRTVSSLIASSSQFENARLILWSNGPRKLECYDVSKLVNLGYEVEIVETLDNKSLAVIYNLFIERNEAEKYVFLDDDSSLNSGYIEEACCSISTEVAMPVISSNGVAKNPKIKSLTLNKGHKVDPEDRVFTIGSGLVVGREVILKLFKHFSKPFDERYYLYGVDTTFCHRLYLSGLTKTVKIISGFDHSLSRFEDESDYVKEFRRKERSYDRGMTLKYYSSLTTSLYVFSVSIVYTIKCMVLRKRSSMSLPLLFKSYLTGKHYRDSDMNRRDK